MSTNKLIHKDNFILLFFSLLPISFILGNASSRAKYNFNYHFVFKRNY